jgi:ribosomal protein S18 acetylase RimI-like enzyme
MAMNKVDIIEYEDQYHGAFQAMNVEWLDQYNLKESHDLMMLNAPRKHILDNGGFIFLARAGEQIVGSSALLKGGDGSYELAKMTVTPLFRNRGISKLLMGACLERARAMGASRIVLFSNHQLKAAIALYEQYGFKHIPVIDSPFTTADVKMELIL